MDDPASEAGGYHRAIPSRSIRRLKPDLRFAFRAEHRHRRPIPASLACTVKLEREVGDRLSLITGTSPGACTGRNQQALQPDFDAGPARSGLADAGNQFACSFESTDAWHGTRHEAMKEIRLVIVDALRGGCTSGDKGRQFEIEEGVFPARPSI